MVRVTEPVQHTLMITVRTHKSPGYLGLQKSYTAKCSCGWVGDEYRRRSWARESGEAHKVLS